MMNDKTRVGNKELYCPKCKEFTSMRYIGNVDELELYNCSCGDTQSYNPKRVTLEREGLVGLLWRLFGKKQ